MSSDSVNKPATRASTFADAFGALLGVVFCTAGGIFFSIGFLTGGVAALAADFGVSFAGALAIAFGTGFVFAFTTPLGAGFVFVTALGIGLDLAFALPVAARVPIVAFVPSLFAFAFAVTNVDSPETHYGRTVSISILETPETQKRVSVLKPLYEFNAII